MKRISVTAFGLLLGVGLAWMALATLVVVPAECGEPAACGDDHLYPALLPVIVSLLGFPIMAFVFGRRLPTRHVALGLVLAAITVAGFIRHLAAA